MKLKNLFYTVFIFTILILLMNCKKTKEEEGNDIPYVFVNFNIDVTSTLYNTLNSPGGWTYYDNAGVKGIIIYRNSMTEFTAYERNCPYQPLNTCSRVNVDKSFSLVIDSCCGSKFILNDGSIFQGPATRGLKTYKTYLDGNILYITN